MSKKKKKRPFVARVPIPVRGGIHVQSVRPQASRKWWAKRWLAFMEELRLGARLGRGRNYALAGQVFSLEVTPGSVVAFVQGGSEEAYRCELRFDVMPEKVKEQILSKLCAKPLLLSQLLVHNLPVSVDRMFRAAGYPLVPSAANSFESSCSCPDYANPCKHLAAVLFILTEAFEQDPLRLLALRGITREDLLARFGGTENAVTDDAAEANGKNGGAGEQKRLKKAAVDLAAFWGSEAGLKDDFGEAPSLSGKLPLVRRLGVVPFWRGDQRFFEAMDQCGERSAAGGWRIWAAERPVREAVMSGRPIESLRAEKVRTARFDEI